MVMLCDDIISNDCLYLSEALGLGQGSGGDHLVDPGDSEHGGSGGLGETGHRRGQAEATQTDQSLALGTLTF